MNQGHNPDKGRNNRPIAESVYTLTEVLRMADMVSDEQLDGAGQRRHLEHGSTMLKASTGAWWRPEVSIERRSDDPSRFNFKFEVRDDGHADASVTAHVWVGNQAWQLVGIADRATGDVSWAHAIMADTDQRNLAGFNFSTTAAFGGIGSHTDRYDIAYIRDNLADSFVGAKERERMSEVEAAASAVARELNNAVEDVTSVAAAS